MYSDIGKISKVILVRVNKVVIQYTNINQWKNTDAVIKWFNSISNKSECVFVLFDIMNFYPSITEQLLDQAVHFSKEYLNITSDELNITMQSRNTLS